MDPMPRRHALKAIGMFGGTLLAAGCTPARILLHWYPSEFDSDRRLVDEVLTAFADVVAPDVVSAGRLTRPFDDRRFPLHRYKGFLAADLCARSKRCTGSERFELLGRPARARVIDDGLAADSTTEKLYSGAIFLTQLACYAGIYDDESGCAAIGFDGRYRPRPLAERTYRNVDDFLAEEVGLDGNHG